MIAQVRFAANWPEPTDDDAVRRARPLFPTEAGNFTPKAQVVVAFERAAQELGLPLHDHNGAPRWGGHAARRGGAQYLARSGVEIWKIQALARHSSDAILLYIEDTHVQSMHSLAAEATLGRSIEMLRDEVSQLKGVAAKEAAKLACKEAPSLVNVDLADVVPDHPDNASEVRNLGVILGPSGHRELVAVKAPPPGLARVPLPPGSPPPPSSSASSSAGVPAVAAGSGAPAKAPPAGLTFQDLAVNARFVVCVRAGGRIHVKHPGVSAVSLCGWRWEAQQLGLPCDTLDSVTQAVGERKMCGRCERLWEDLRADRPASLSDSVSSEESSDTDA